MNNWKDVANEFGWKSLNEHYRFPAIRGMAEEILKLRGAKDMILEDAIVKAMADIQIIRPEWAAAYLALTIRISQLTTDVSTTPPSSPPEDQL